MPFRRSFIAAGLVGALALPFVSQPLNARSNDGPQGTTAVDAAQASSASASREKFVQVPGVYRQKIGSLEVTALFDGTVSLPENWLKDVDLNSARAWMNASYVPQSPQGIQTAVNAYLIRTGNELVLVDAGAARCFGDGLGRVQENLAAANVDPEAITQVLLTHAHPDHICGLLTLDDKVAFPNATLWLAVDDADYWFSTDARDAAPKAMQPAFDMARHAVEPYQKAGRLKTFKAGDSLPAGAVAIPSPGHTPGHTSWLLRGGPDEKTSLLVWGDIVHYHAVQFRRPSASFEPDSNRRKAVATRKRLLNTTARKGWWVAGAHLPFPGIGHVQTSGKRAYRWVPAEFGPIAD